MNKLNMQFWDHPVIFPLIVLSCVHCWSYPCEVMLQGVHCNLHTGQERQILAGAKHVSCTIEMASTTRQWDCAVVDEIQVGVLLVVCCKQGTSSS